MKHTCATRLALDECVRPPCSAFRFVEQPIFRPRSLPDCWNERGIEIWALSSFKDAFFSFSSMRACIALGQQVEVGAHSEQLSRMHSEPSPLRCHCEQLKRMHWSRWFPCSITRSFALRVASSRPHGCGIHCCGGL